MKSCPGCGHVQSDGNFCGECGTSLSALQKRSETGADPPMPRDGVFDEWGTALRTFLQFTARQVKGPTAHLNISDSHLPHSAISIALYFLLTSTSYYTLFSDQLSAPAWLPILLQGSLLMCLFLVVNLVSMSAALYVFSTPEPVRELIRKLGGFYSVPITLSSASLLLTFIDAAAIALILLSLGALLAFLLIPLYIIIILLAGQPQTIDGFNGLLFYVSCTIVAAILLFVFIDGTAIGELLHVLR